MLLRLIGIEPLKVSASQSSSNGGGCSAMLMSDGSLNLVEYELNGDTVEARFSSPLQEGGPDPVVTQDWVTCGFLTLGTVAAIATIPATGGWSIVAAGAAAGASSYECAQAGKS